MTRLTARQWVARQLAGGDADGRGLSFLNWLLAFTIVASVTTAVIATERSIAARFASVLHTLEAGFGAIFVVEYLARIWTAAEESGPQSSIAKRARFVLSPMGLLDLLVIAATLTPLVASDLAVLRIIRLMRLLTLAKLGRFSGAFRDLSRAIVERRFELLVTIVLAAVLVLFGATALYLVEGSQQPEKFGSIPRALWWSIITLTTVGYGDVSPVTPLGKVLASVVAVAGIGLVAMPTGILAAAFSDAMERRRSESGYADR